jgi:hypothetical protein
VERSSSPSSTHLAEDLAQWENLPTNFHEPEMYPILPAEVEPEPRVLVEPQEHLMRTRNPPTRYGEWIYPVNRNSYACMATIEPEYIPEEPATFDEAMASPERQEWIAAMKSEYESLIKNNTWMLQNLPAGRHPISNKWVFKLKIAADGSIHRFKARLVARGFTQREGLDYNETVSPVVKFDSIRTILSIVAADDMEIIQFDVCTAFLNASVEEEIYMSQPKGFVNLQPRMS